MAETWLATSPDAQLLSELVPPGCKILHVARPDKTSGGALTLVKGRSAVKTVYHKGDVFTCFENWQTSSET